MAPAIDIGIINYNSGNHLDACIASLRQNTHASFRIFVLDNASTDASFNEVSRRHPEVHCIASSVNLGYAGGINQLFQHMDAPLLAFCNMDLEFSPDWVTTICACYDAHPEADSVVPLVIEKESGKVYSSSVNFFWDLHPLSTKIAPDTSAPYPVVNAYGAAMTFRRSVIERTGGFDADYFLFFEETDFYLRMHILGMKTLFCPSARIFHERSVSTVRFSPRKLYYSERNRLLTAFKCLPFWYVPLLFPISIFRFYLMSTSGLPKSDGEGKKVSKAATLATLLSAWLAAVRLLPETVKKRKLLWKNAVIPNHGILTLISQHRVTLDNVRKSMNA